MQVTKKERPEPLKTVTISPSESTHFRVILSSEAMENETRVTKDVAASSSVCTVVKPEPRTPVPTVTPETSQGSISTEMSVSPVTPTEPLDVLPPSVATSTPSNSQLNDSPSKKKGIFSVSLHFFLQIINILEIIDNCVAGCRCPKEESASGT